MGCWFAAKTFTDNIINYKLKFRLAVDSASSLSSSPSSSLWIFWLLLFSESQSVFLARFAAGGGVFAFAFELPFEFEFEFEFDLFRPLFALTIFRVLRCFPFLLL